MSDETTLWRRIRDGHHAVVVGGLVPEAPEDVRTLRVLCDAHRGALGPLLELERQAHRALGEPERTSDPWSESRPRELRWRLFGDHQGDDRRDLIAGTLSRVGADQAQVVLIFEAVDHADPATLGFLADALARPEWLTTPVLLHFTEPPADGSVGAALLARADSALGAAAFFHTVPVEVPPEGPSDETLGALGPDLLLVLRACAVAGSPFDAELVARLLERPTVRLLEALQTAVDAGVPLTDAGDGRLRLPDTWIATLSAGVLPSLLSWWHRRLAELLTPERPAPEAPTPAPSPGPEPSEEQAPARSAGPSASNTPAPDVARAASHYEAAGVPGQAIRRQLAAAEEAIALGAFDEAADHIRRAELALPELSAPGERQLLQVGVLVELARLQWRTATLDEALGTLEEAASLADDGVPLGVRGQVAAMLAAVLYDIGDPSSLRRALDALSEMIRRYQGAQRPLEAAGMLNDQAAIWVRLGDPVRASHLLRSSRKAFAAHAERSVAARRELAQTDHLLARLTLHVAARPGRERDALEVALSHAESAAETYQLLEDEGALARVWETTARLELERGRPEAALPLLEQAAAVEERRGDLLGLAQTAEAFSRAMSQAGRPDEALRLLAVSVEFNKKKGSPRGLAYNRDSLARLVEEAPPQIQRALLPSARELMARIEAALTRRQPSRSLD